MDYIYLARSTFLLVQYIEDAQWHQYKVIGTVHYWYSTKRMHRGISWVIGTVHYWYSTHEMHTAQGPKYISVFRMYNVHCTYIIFSSYVVHFFWYSTL